MIFYLLWHNVIRWRSHICKKSVFNPKIFLSWWSLVNNTEEVMEYNWRSVTKLNGVKNAIMQVIYIVNGPMFNLLFCCHIVWYWEKVASYKECNHKSKLYGKFQRFDAIDGSTERLKMVKFAKISIKMKNCKTFYEAQTASRP